MASEPLRVFANFLVSAPARFKEPVSVLSKEFCLTRPEDEPSDPVKILTRLFAPRPAREIEPVRVWPLSHPGVTMSEAAETVVSVVVVADVEPEYCITCQYSTTRYLPVQPLKAACDAEVHVYLVAVVEPITLLVDVSQFLNRNVQLASVLLPHCHTVIQILPTGELVMGFAETVVSNCQVPDCMSTSPLCIPAVS